MIVNILENVKQRLVEKSTKTPAIYFLYLLSLNTKDENAIFTPRRKCQKDNAGKEEEANLETEK